MATDPSPLATGPTKWRAEHCVTHHHACDCREWEHAEQIAALESRLAAADALLRKISMESVNWVSADDAVRCCNRIAELTRDLQGSDDEA